MAAKRPTGYLPDNPLPSYWLKDITLGTVRPELPEKVDAIVVGAGISGTSTAYHLRQLRPDWNIAVLEGRDVSGGATGRNGGLILPGLHDTWSATVKQIGVEQTRQLLKFDHLNCAAMSGFVSDYLAAGGSPNPFFHRFAEGCLNLLSTDKEMQFWRMELQHMRDAGCGEGIALLDRQAVKEKVGTDKYVGAVQLQPAFRMWPARFVLAVATQAMKASGGRGSVQVFTHTLVKLVRSSNDAEHPLEVITSRGSLRARRVIYCTNSHTRTLLPEIPIVPIRNQVIVTKPIQPPPFDACMLANDGYEYLSSREDGRIVLGGLRFLAPDMDVGNGNDGHLDPKVSAALRSYLDTYYPQLGNQATVEMEWAGIMGFSQDRLPFVGPVPGRPGEYVSAGFNGHGMSRAFLSGKHVAEMAAGRQVGEGFPRCFLPDGREKKHGQEKSLPDNVQAFRSKM
ncbi:hypothetical protein HDU86_002568 [Geranomyces michiganensis]|nr:hypothetical protein HDU86_002568 [Geranomyces michiganensis]